MRTAVCLFAVAVAAAPAAAQSAPFVAEVTAESTPIRSGPGDNMPDTGTLFRGARLIVDHEEGDAWVAVQPPRGQVSWVRNANLGPPTDGQTADQLPRNAVVAADPDAEIALGRPGFGKPLDVRRTRVPDQTIVMVIGKVVEVDGVKWHPIDPPDGDFRYVPKSAVRFLRGQPVQSFVVRSPKPEPPAGDPIAATNLPKSAEPVTLSLGNPARTAPPVPAGGKPADWPNHPLWQQADQAERDGDFARAEQLYMKLAPDMNRPGGDAELANLCYARVHAVREKQRSAGRGGWAAAGNGGGNGGSPDRGGAAAKPAAGGERWAGPGVLREAGFRIENRPTFALTAGQGGRVVCYAVAGPGVSLDRYVRAEVELAGTLDYPGDLRGAGVMTVTQVRAAR